MVLIPENKRNGDIILDRRFRGKSYSTEDTGRKLCNDFVTTCLLDISVTICT